MLKKIADRNDLHPSVLVSVRAPSLFFGREKVKDSLSVVDWHMPASLSPMGYAIGIRDDDSIGKMISTAGNFVVNFMGKHNDELMAAANSQDSALSDSFVLLGLTKIDGTKVESPRVGEAAAFLECEVIQELESGDHIIFLGRVLHSGNR